MFTTPHALLVSALLSVAAWSTAAQDVATTLASQYGLAASTALPFPTATLASSDAQAFLIDNWAVGKGPIVKGKPNLLGGSNLAFTADPFVSSRSHTHLCRGKQAAPLTFPPPTHLSRTSRSRTRIPPTKETRLRLSFR
jgi:hypothetical protein